MAIKSGCSTKKEVNTERKKGFWPACMGDLLLGWCTCGCFLPDTKISVFNEQEKNIQKIKFGDVLINLDKDSSFSNWRLYTAKVKLTTVGEETNDIINIVLENGRTLFLTSQHAVLTSQGILIPAEKVRKSHTLIDINGFELMIQNIKKTPYEGLVYNVELDVVSDEEHIIFAEGVAVGDLAYQNTLIHELYRIKIRK